MAEDIEKKKKKVLVSSKDTKEKKPRKKIVVKKKEPAEGQKEVEHIEKGVEPEVLNSPPIENETASSVNPDAASPQLVTIDESSAKVVVDDSVKFSNSTEETPKLHDVSTKKKRKDGQKKNASQEAPLEKKQYTAQKESAQPQPDSSSIRRAVIIKSSHNVKVKTTGTAKSIDIISARPNVKAGNLSDASRKRNQGFHSSGQNYKRRDGNFQNNGQQHSGERKFGFQRQFDRKSLQGQTGIMGSGFGGQKKNFTNPLDIPMEQSKTAAAKKAHKAKKIYSKKTNEDDFLDEKPLQHKKKVKEKAYSVPKEIKILEKISISELAKKMNLRASELIGKLMEMGMMVTLNQLIEFDTAVILASEYGCDVKGVNLYEETIIESVSDEGAELISRPPVVTIMGHVDHGKTKTLDAIRSTNVIAGEFGGITQHIGAYTVNTPGGKITFLDTPGHAAFTMMRSRGAAVTDIVVLVVAADDGVMPQTIEAINHAKAADVPIIVAVNKIDKPEANPDKVKTRLSELGLMPEEWGGNTMFVEISALKKQGIDALLEAILLNAEVLELKANYNCAAEGKVIESKIDHGRGVVATVLIQRGTLSEGDPYVAGIYAGHVRAIFNDRGERIKKAEPSMPVEILGLEEMPNAGDPFQVTVSDKAAKQISNKRRELKRFEDARHVKKVTLDNLYETIHDGEMLELKVIIKGDVQGSVEALKQSLEELSRPEIRLNVIHASAGAINESDVMLAAADSNAIIIGFNVRPTPQAKSLAEQEKVDIRKYNVIYQATEEIKAAMEGMLSPDLKEEVVGSVEVRDIFKVPKIGRIAGSYVLSGVVKRNSLVHVIRDGIVVHSGKITSLKRFKDDAKEVNAGFECGIGIEGFNDLQIGDTLEIIEVKEIARKLSDADNYQAPEIKQNTAETSF